MLPPLELFLFMGIHQWVLALAPGLMIAMAIYYFDKYEKEPFKLILKAFLLGCISVIPAYYIERFAFYYFDDFYGNFFKAAIASYIVIGLTEEGSKFLFFRKFLFKHRELNEPYDAILYAVMVSLGFATVENVLYVMEGGSKVALLRMFTAVPAHAAFAILFGYFAGLAKFAHTKSQSFILLSLGLLIAVLVHGTYDLLLFIGNNYWIIFGAFLHFILALYLAFRAVRIHRHNSNFK